MLQLAIPLQQAIKLHMKAKAQSEKTEREAECSNGSISFST